MKTKIFISGIDYTKYVVSISESKQFEEGCIIGNTPSTELSLSVDNSSGVFNNLLDSQFVLKLGETQIGVFNVLEKPEMVTSELSLTLSDNMIKANIMYDSKISYPCKVKIQLDEMVVTFKINIDYSAIPKNILDKEINFYDNTVSIRNHLSWIAEMCACNVIATGQGALKFVQLSKLKKYDLPSDDVEDFKSIDVYKISRIKLDNGLLVVEKGDWQFNTLYINPNNPYVEAQSDIDYIHSILWGMTFTSARGFKIAGINNLQLGEMIRYNNKFNFIAMNIKTDYIGALYDLQEVSGEMKIKANETVINRNTESVKIRGLKVISDQNNAQLQIIAKEQDGLNEKVSNLEIDVDGVSIKTEEALGTMYKMEMGKGNIFNDCQQSISKDINDSTTKSLSIMPLGVNKNDLINKDICIAVDIWAQNAIQRSLSGYMGAYFSITYEDGTVKKYSTVFVAGLRYFQYKLTTTTQSMYQRIFTHFKIENKAIKSVSNLTIEIALNGELLKVSNPKVEYGVTPTGFAFDNKAIRDSIVTMDKKYTSIVSTVDALTLQSVAMTEEITTINGNVSTLTTRLNSTELKLTPTAITAMVNEKIGADGELKTTKVTINSQGLNVYGGGIRIYNNANTPVFYADNQGNLTLSAHITYAQIDGANINISQDARIGKILYLGSASNPGEYRYISLNGGVVVPNSDVAGEVIAYRNNEITIHSKARASLVASQGTGAIAGISCKVLSDGRTIIEASQQITVTSDIRKKSNVYEVDVNWIDELHVVEFNYNANTTKQIGLIAQKYIGMEYSKYFLSCDDNGFYGISYGNIMNALIKYCQEMKIQQNHMINKLAELEGRALYARN